MMTREPTDRDDIAESGSARALACSVPRPRGTPRDVTTFGRTACNSNLTPAGEGAGRNTRGRVCSPDSVAVWDRWRRLLALALVLLAPLVAAANEVSAGFEAANKLYEQAKYREAAAAYEKLANSGSRVEAIYFNLGNAWFKAGQTGRAIAAWREAEAIRPRDPGVRFNLAFARKHVTGSEAPAASAWQRGLRTLTLNEWAVLTSVALWLWFLLLSLREFRPALRPALSGYTAAAGGVLLLLAVCFGAAANLQFAATPAVTIVPEALARSGPLDEAKVLHQFRDGKELTILDRKEIAGDAMQTWWQVRDAAGRTGWVKGDNLVTLHPPAKS